MQITMTPERRFKCMSNNRAKNIGPERRLRLCLWRQGFRYRVNEKHLPGRPDIVLLKYRTVVFVIIEPKEKELSLLQY
ncbi:MAG: hypothetical protein IJU63_04890 [Bacteroidales bacterium]|nr:hypothetical protein [Bacteroidales bacterium]